MAKVPIPERGQPLDVTYIYSLAQSINDLTNQLSPATYKYSTVNTENAKTSDVRLYAESKVVANNSTVTAGSEISFDIDFQTDFKATPVVTATPVNLGKTPAGNDVVVSINSLSARKLNGTVKFNASGNVLVLVHVIAVGIPN